MQGMINRIFGGGNWRRREVRNLENHYSTTEHTQDKEENPQLQRSTTLWYPEQGRRAGFSLRVIRVLCGRSRYRVQLARKARRVASALTSPRAEAMPVGTQRTACPSSVGVLSVSR